MQTKSTEVHFQTLELCLASVAACDKTPALPSNVVNQWIEVRSTGSHSLLAMKSRQFDLVKIETRNGKNDKYFENKMLSYRRETALEAALVLANNGRLELGDNILRTL